jgi:hypothetical protein
MIQKAYKFWPCAGFRIHFPITFCVVCVGVVGVCFSDHGFGNHFMADHVTFLVHGVHLYPYWRGGGEVATLIRPLVYHRILQPRLRLWVPKCSILHSLCVGVPVDRAGGCDAQSSEFYIRVVFLAFRMGGSGNTPPIQGYGHEEPCSHCRSMKLAATLSSVKLRMYGVYFRAPTREHNVIPKHSVWASLCERDVMTLQPIV